MNNSQSTSLYAAKLPALPLLIYKKANLKYKRVTLLPCKHIHACSEHGNRFSWSNNHERYFFNEPHTSDANNSC